MECNYTTHTWRKKITRRYYCYNRFFALSLIWFRNTLVVSQPATQCKALAIATASFCLACRQANNRILQNGDTAMVVRYNSVVGDCKKKKKKCFMATKSFHERKTQIWMQLWIRCQDQSPANTPTRQRACHCMSDHEEAVKDWVVMPDIPLQIVLKQVSVSWLNRCMLLLQLDQGLTPSWKQLGKLEEAVFQLPYWDAIVD